MESPESELVVFHDANVHTLDEGQAHGSKRRSVLVRAGRIEAVVDAADAPEAGAAVRRVELAGAHLAPGFIDLQVNGGGGVNLNDDPSPDTVARIVRAHRRFGTTSLLPTFITGPLDDMRRAADAVRAHGGRAGTLGIHFEGPFLDAEKRGAHEAQQIRRPADPELELLEEARRSGVVLLTLAANALDDATARRLSAAGVHISLGHSKATYAEASAAFDRGATLVTHLFNAMSPFTSREPGLVGAALDAAAVGRARAGLILDLVHVDPAAARVAVRAAGRGGIFLVTDAVAPVGTNETELRLGGQLVRVEGGRCINEEGALAGSILDMATAVRNARAHLDVGLDEALAMASLYPAEAIGVASYKGRIAPGFDADLVWFDDDLHVLGTAVAGRVD